MIAVGGWGGRDEKSGPMVRWRDRKVVFGASPEAGGTHGTGHAFMVGTREPQHPIMQLPRLEARRGRILFQAGGPAKNLNVLATAKAEPGKGGTPENEPIHMVTVMKANRDALRFFAQGTNYPHCPGLHPWIRPGVSPLSQAREGQLA